MEQRYVLSEEMSDGYVPATLVGERRLTNLAKLLRMELDYSILVTVREPTAAMFSFYTERYEQFSRSRRELLRTVARDDERMEIFHYKTLMEVLLRQFRCQPIFLRTRFEDIVGGRNEEACAASCSFRPSGLGWLQAPPAQRDRGEPVMLVYTRKKFTLADIPRRLADSTRT